MAEPYLGEIHIFGFNFAPRGWALCDGQILPIHQNQSLYSILGTTYGGDGRTTFALPDLRGRVPVHVGNDITLGEKAGEESVPLTINEMPNHVHEVQASNQLPNREGPAGNFWAASSANPYAGAAAGGTMLNTVQNTGGGSGHENMQPFLTLNFCIALSGIFPSRN
ncbi:MAG: phage tail protein [bacterium]|nr:phage tail protein [bacterium]